MPCSNSFVDLSQIDSKVQLHNQCGLSPFKHFSVDVLHQCSQRAVLGPWEGFDFQRNCRPSGNCRLVLHGTAHFQDVQVFCGCSFLVFVDVFNLCPSKSAFYCRSQSVETLAAAAVLPKAQVSPNAFDL